MATGRSTPSAGEECDDGGQVSGDGCRADCTIEFCGDGIQDALEQCDESGETKTCDVDCTLATCGDSTLNATRGEECDDGNTVDGDGCEANCTTADAADRTRFAAKERVLPGSDELGAPESAFVADVDGDGDPDVLTASSSDNLIGWFENINGEATFNTLKVISTSVLSAKDVTAADIDGDGDLDALSAASGDGTIAWYANQDGAGSFGPAIAISSAVTSASAVLVADIDGDGDADVIAGGAADGPNALVWFENTDGAGSFGPPNPISGAGTTSVVLADIKP